MIQYYNIHINTIKILILINFLIYIYIKYIKINYYFSYELKMIDNCNLIIKIFKIKEELF